MLIAVINKGGQIVIRNSDRGIRRLTRRNIFGNKHKFFIKPEIRNFTHCVSKCNTRTGNRQYRCKYENNEGFTIHFL